MLVVRLRPRASPPSPALRAALAAVARAVPVVWDPHPRGPTPVPGRARWSPRTAPRRRASPAAGPAAARLAGRRRGRRAARSTGRWRAGGGGASRSAPAGRVLAGAAPAPAAASCRRRAVGRPATPAAPATASPRPPRRRLAAGALPSRGGDARPSPRPPRSSPPAAPAALCRRRPRAGAAGDARRARRRWPPGPRRGRHRRGHRRLLRPAARRPRRHAARRPARSGDCLVVCLNSDASVRRLKGPDRPLVRRGGPGRGAGGARRASTPSRSSTRTPRARVLRRAAPATCGSRAATTPPADLPEAAAARRLGRPGRGRALPGRPLHHPAASTEVTRQRRWAAELTAGNGAGHRAAPRVSAPRSPRRSRRPAARRSCSTCDAAGATASRFEQVDLADARAAEAAVRARRRARRRPRRAWSPPPASTPAATLADVDRRGLGPGRRWSTCSAPPRSSGPPCPHLERVARHGRHGRLDARPPGAARDATAYCAQQVRRGRLHPRARGRAAGDGRRDAARPRRDAHRASSTTGTSSTSPAADAQLNDPADVAAGRRCSRCASRPAARCASWWSRPPVGALLAVSGPPWRRRACARSASGTCSPACPALRALAERVPGAPAACWPRPAGSRRWPALTGAVDEVLPARRPLAPLPPAPARRRPRGQPARPRAREPRALLAAPRRAG